MQGSFSWWVFLSSDHQHIVVGDRISSAYYVQIYTFNNGTKKFDPPSNSTLIPISGFIYFASLSEDKKYLAVSSISGVYLYSNPLSLNPILEQTIITETSERHKFSKNGKYLIFSENQNIKITISCKNEPNTIYDDASQSCVPCSNNTVYDDASQSCAPCSNNTVYDEPLKAVSHVKTI